MNSYKIIFNRFTKIVVFWNWYDNAIEYVTQQLCCIFLLLFSLYIKVYAYWRMADLSVCFASMDVERHAGINYYPF